MYAAVVLLALGTLATFGVSHGSESEPTDAVWIYTAGDYENIWNWSATSPSTHDGLVVFDPATNDTTNRFAANAGEPVYVWAWWHDTDSSNTDLNLLVSNGTHHHTGVIDQWGGGPTLPVESVAFVPPGDSHYDISIAVIGAAIPDRVQLFAGGINGPPEYAEGAASGTGHPDGRDHTQVSLVVTTRNPSCTAVFLSSYDVTRHSDVQAGYMYPDDLRNGVNMVFGAHADEAYDLVPLLVERPAISSAAVYSTGAPTELLAQDVNPDVYVNPVEMAWREFARSLARAVGLDAYAADGHGPCEISESLLLNAVSALRAADSGDADSAPQWKLVHIGIHTDNLTHTSAYLKENGAVVAGPVNGDEGSIDARVPVPILMPLTNAEYVTRIDNKVPHYCGIIEDPPFPVEPRIHK